MQGSLVALFWLCVLSLGPVRRLCHELFYILHMVGVLRLSSSLTLAIILALD